MITITSRQHNFRRCGVAHPSPATEYPDGCFTQEQIALLTADPMLTVVISAPVEMESQAARRAAEAMTVAQLTERLEALKINIPQGSKKPALVELYLAATDYVDGAPEA